MIVTKCDRCGKEIHASKYFKLYHRCVIDYNISDLREFDLCEECATRVYEFVKGENK